MSQTLFWVLMISVSVITLLFSKFNKYTDFDWFELGVYALYISIIVFITYACFLENHMFS